MACNSVCISTWRICQTRVYHSQDFGWKRFKLVRFKLLWGCECKTVHKRASFPKRTSNSSKLISRTMDAYYTLRSVSEVRSSTFCTPASTARCRHGSYGRQITEILRQLDSVKFYIPFSHITLFLKQSIVSNAV